MTSIDLSIEQRELRNRYENLKKEFAHYFSIKNDMLLFEAPLLTANYLKLVGQKQFEVFSLRTELRIIKRKIEMMQAYINRNKFPDMKEIELKLDAEFQDYYKKLQEDAAQLKAADEYLKSPLIASEKVKLIKEAYYAIVKKLHPDLNPDLTEYEKEVFVLAQAAYEVSDLDTLQEILVSLEIKSGELDVKEYSLQDRIVELGKKVDALKEQIGKMKMTFPFLLEKNLADENWVAEKQREADEEIANLKIEIQKFKQYLILLEEWEPIL